MLTKNPRINITFEESMVGLLSELAEQEHKSVSRLARELILEGLERREDIALSKMADRLDKRDVKTYSHDDAWK